MLSKLPQIVLLCIVIFSCRSNAPDTSSKLEEDITGFSQIEEVKDVYYRFPSPDEMLNFIDREKLAFDDGLLLPVEQANSYLDSRSQAMNLGVYIADMAYITLFQRQKEAFVYFQTIYGLSDELRLSSAFDIDLMRRFEDNFKNSDSLTSLADLAMTEINSYLISYGKENTFTIISIGGFVESLYIAFHLAGGYNPENEIIQRISDQKYVLDNMVKYAHEYTGDQNVVEALAYLEPIRSVYNKLLVSTEETNVSRAEDGKLIIAGGSKISISKAQYIELKGATFSARKSITENLEN